MEAGKETEQEMIEDLCEEIHDLIEDKQKIDAENTILQDELGAKKKEVMDMGRTIQSLSRILDDLKDKTDQCNADMVENESLLEHKMNTIKHQEEIISIITENNGAVQQCYESLQKQLKTMNKHVKRLTAEYEAVNDQFRTQASLLEGLDKHAQQDNAVVKELKEDIGKIKQMLLAETKILHHKEEEMGRITLKVSRNQKENDLKALQTNKLKGKIEEMKENLMKTQRESSQLRRCIWNLGTKAEALQCKADMKEKLLQYYKHTANLERMESPQRMQDDKQDAREKCRAIKDQLDALKVENTDKVESKHASVNESTELSGDGHKDRDVDEPPAVMSELGDATMLTGWEHRPKSKNSSRASTTKTGCHVELIGKNCFQLAFKNGWTPDSRKKNYKEDLVSKNFCQAELKKNGCLAEMMKNNGWQKNICSAEMMNKNGWQINLRKKNPGNPISKKGCKSRCKTNSICTNRTDLYDELDNWFTEFENRSRDLKVRATAARGKAKYQKRSGKKTKILEIKLKRGC